MPSDLSRSRFRGVDLSGVVMRGVELVGVEITGEVVDVTINGVDVGPLVEAELDRRYPERVGDAPHRRGRLPRRPGTSSSGCGPRPSRGPAPRPGAAARVGRSTASGRSSRPCGTSPSPRTPGSGGRSWAIRRRGTRWTCRGTRCRTRRAFRATATCARRSTSSLDLRRDRMATVRAFARRADRRVAGGATPNRSTRRAGRGRAAIRCGNAC